MATSIRSRPPSARSSWQPRGDARKAVHWLGTAGWTAKGILYVLIGIIALEVAFGATNEQASKQGALRTLVQQPAGSVLVGLVAIGLFAFAAYRVLTILFDDAEGHERAAHAAVRSASAAIYVVVGVQAIALLVSSDPGSDANATAKTWSARLLDSGVGTALLVAVAIGILVFAGYQLYVGFSKRFMDELATPAGAAASETGIVLLGMIGIVARAIVAGLIGVFLLEAVIAHDPNEAEGLDGALRQLQQKAMGPTLLALVAAGLAAYGLFCLASARYRRLTGN
jgi:hypothetical protein